MGKLSIGTLFAVTTIQDGNYTHFAEIFRYDNFIYNKHDNPSPTQGYSMSNKIKRHGLREREQVTFIGNKCHLT